MSNYGPPGGPNHGDPQEPSSGAPAPDPYDTPSDPWGDAEQDRARPGDAEPWPAGVNPWPASAWPGGEWAQGPDQPWPAGQDRSPEGPGQWAGHDQWSGHDRWGGQPASTPPDGGGPTMGFTSAGATARHGHEGPGPLPTGPVYPPVPQPSAAPDTAYTVPGATWSPATPEGSNGRGSRTGFVVVLSILAALVLGSGALAVYLVGDRAETRTVSESGADPTGADTRATDDDPDDASGDPYVETAPSTPGSDPSRDARFVTVGQCVANEGDEEEPRLAITECQDGTYEVLRRFDGATTGKDDAKEKCAQVAGYTDWYFFDSPFDALDYVLCLKQR